MAVFDNACSMSSLLHGLLCRVSLLALQETWADQIRAAGFKAVTYENMTGGVVAIHSGFKL
jgi:ubiquinone/menaquinone biosynthesis C-methylase UbiE